MSMITKIWDELTKDLWSRCP